jgi:hypothetical protein
MDAVAARVPANKVEGYLDGKIYLRHTLPQPVSGKIGLWSKADSYMHFDDFSWWRPSEGRRDVGEHACTAA